MTANTGRTLLFVHAHPDDETLATGVTLAQRAIDGADVHVLTCTLGDEGEVIPVELAHHLSAMDDTLGRYRRLELRAAMTALGVVEHVLGEDVGGPGAAAYRDSGMAGTPTMQHPRALSGVPLHEVVDAIAEHLRALAPDVVVTYDPQGGYQHPDHVRVHRATCAAVARLPRQARPALWAVVVRRSRAAADRAWLAEHVRDDGHLTIPGPGDPYPAGVVDDALIAWEVTGDAEALARRDAALAEHRTQVHLGDGWYALSNDIAARLPTTESYVPLDPDTGALAPVAADQIIDERRAP
ncbi:MAG: PIG-L family deacetylase [Actinobacteria bacterium]|nr:PIG-L family deacetylase [Actinomycetota bacterium]